MQVRSLYTRIPGDIATTYQHYCFMKYLLILILSCFTTTIFAQDSLSRTPWQDTIRTHNDFSLMAGLHGGKYFYAELGVGKVVWHQARRGAGGYAVGLSSEVQIGRNALVAPKLSFVFGSLVSIGGISALYYTNFKIGTFVLRPEMGIGVPHARLVYGYNFRFEDKRLRGIPSHMVSLIAFPLPIVSKKEIKPLHR